MEVRELVDKDQFAKYCGIELTEVSTGTATAKMAIQPHHLNGVGIVQGGALFTLADFALAAASNSHNVVAVGLVSNINYFKAESSGTLYAKAREISLRRTIACYHVDITNEQNELIAAFQGTVYRKN
ncbi:MAG: PaaI family thioesterase [Bacteroidales bacterium]|jgi:acyl-CoA thioesterase|nr:PaaI family thioesterase [Bacteroidales bacterium]